MKHLTRSQSIVRKRTENGIKCIKLQIKTGSFNLERNGLCPKTLANNSCLCHTFDRLLITKNFSVPPSRQAAKACTSYDRNSSRSTTSSSITTPKRASQSPKRHSACADAQDLNPNAIRRHLSRHLRNSFPASPT